LRVASFGATVSQLNNRLFDVHFAQVNRNKSLGENAVPNPITDEGESKAWLVSEACSDDYQRLAFCLALARFDRSGSHDRCGDNPVKRALLRQRVNKHTDLNYWLMLAQIHPNTKMPISHAKNTAHLNILSCLFAFNRRSILQPLFTHQCSGHGVEGLRSRKKRAKHRPPRISSRNGLPAGQNAKITWSAISRERRASRSCSCCGIEGRKHEATQVGRNVAVVKVIRDG